MTHFEPGDKVACVDASACEGAFRHGGVYEVGPVTEDHPNYQAVTIVGAQGFWDASRFRKEAPEPPKPSLYWVRVFGAGLRNHFGQGEHHVVLHPQDVIVRPDGMVTIKTAPVEAGETPAGNKIKARPPTGVTYPPGIVHRIDIGEILPRERSEA